MEHACSDGACLSDKVAVQRYVSSRVCVESLCVCVCVCRWCARPLPLGPIANYTKPQVTLYNLLHFTHTHTHTSHTLTHTHTHTSHTHSHHTHMTHTHTHTHTNHTTDRSRSYVGHGWPQTLSNHLKIVHQKNFWFTIIFVKFVSQCVFKYFLVTPCCAH